MDTNRLTVKTLLLGVLLAAVAADLRGAATDHVTQTTNASATTPDPADPVEKEYQKLLADDDAAQTEVDQWIEDDRAFAAKGAGQAAAELNRRILARFGPVRKGYEDFLKRHPGHVRARVAYGSFLGDIHDEEGEQEQLEKALTLETNNPAIYNNLANIYSHTGPVTKAFDYWAKAIGLNPKEPLYYHSLGTAVYLFRKDAREFYGITEQQVFDKALQLYSDAMKLDPTNFPLATDVAETYYGIQPRRLRSVDHARLEEKGALHTSFGLPKKLQPVGVIFFRYSEVMESAKIAAFDILANYQKTLSDHRHRAK